MSDWMLSPSQEMARDARDLADLDRERSARWNDEPLTHAKVLAAPRTCTNEMCGAPLADEARCGVCGRHQ